jgi:hypothetical protein
LTRNSCKMVVTWLKIMERKVKLFFAFKRDFKQKMIGLAEKSGVEFFFFNQKI